MVIDNPSRVPTTPVICTQLVTRFDRNSERPITLELLRSIRRHIARNMVTASASGRFVWRLARTPSGLTMTAFWHPRRETAVALARAIRAERRERRRLAGPTGAINRRRLGHRP